MVGGEGIDQVVYFGRRHPFVDVGSDVVEQGRIDSGTLADAGQLLFRAEQMALGQAHPVAFELLDVCLHFIRIVFRSEPHSFQKFFHESIIW